MNSKRKGSLPAIMMNDERKLLSRLRRIYTPASVQPDAFGRRRASPREIEQALFADRSGSR